MIQQNHGIKILHLCDLVLLEVRRIFVWLGSDYVGLIYGQW